MSVQQPCEPALPELMPVETKKHLIALLLQKGILLPSSFLSKLNDTSITKLITRIKDPNLSALSTASELIQVLQAPIPPTPPITSTAVLESPCPGKAHPFPIRVEVNLEDADNRQRIRMESGEFKVRVVSDYNEKPQKREISDFVSFFNARYKTIETILRARQELIHVISISRIQQKKGKESVALIGMVFEKSITKTTQSVRLTLEDPTGQIQAIISKKNPELYSVARDLCEDEVIGLVGTMSSSSDNPILYCNNILLPDIPITKELKKSPQDHPGYAAFISDIHIGSKQFLEENFRRMIQWLKGNAGNEAQRVLSSEVRYLFVGGDLVDGVGIYPGQEEELNIPDIYAQYRVVAELFSQLPDRLKVIIIPGNHDAMRLNEPQPRLYKDICKPVWELNNVMLVSNPSMVNIHATESFSGFDVLMYHGYSFDYYVANVDSIRTNGGYDRADLIMKYLLQRRHLAPAHTSTAYIPDSNRDPLVISKVPDFFLTGHIHRVKVASYRNVTMINGGCWQDITPFQVKTGHTPEPCRVSLMNLQTREVRLLRF